ncbi:hypothetical protein F5146DRAFT_1004345 [Armillaria mellea]|nr:hypothetical protein F5146DRAFT_1004345 [Armillaria mellea]
MHSKAVNCNPGLNLEFLRSRKLLVITPKFSEAQKSYPGPPYLTRELYLSRRAGIRPTSILKALEATFPKRKKCATIGGRAGDPDIILRIRIKSYRVFLYKMDNQGCGENENDPEVAPRSVEIRERYGMETKATERSSTATSHRYTRVEEPFYADSRRSHALARKDSKRGHRGGQKERVSREQVRGMGEQGGSEILFANASDCSATMLGLLLVNPSGYQTFFHKELAFTST